MTTKQEVAILKRFGAKHVKAYFLLNNRGYHFDFNGVYYDARFWYEMDGVALNEWKVSPSYPALEHALNAAEG